MASPTLLAQATNSSPGTLRPSLGPSALMTPPQDRSPTQTTISPTSLVGFKTGEASSSTGPARPLALPAEEMLAAAPQLQPRILTVTNEDFYQWRQILGTYKKQVRASIADSKNHS